MLTNVNLKVKGLTTTPNHRGIGILLKHNPSKETSSQDDFPTFPPYPETS